MRALNGIEVFAVGGGDLWVYENSDGSLNADMTGAMINHYAQNSQNEYWTAFCSVFGNVVEGGFALAGASIVVSYPAGIAGEAWCNTGFANSSGGGAAESGGDSGFGGGGAGGSWAPYDKDLQLIVRI